MKILCIEDGSVDLDTLLDKKEWRDDKAIVYRKGSRPPFVVEVTENCNYERCWNELKDYLERSKDDFNGDYQALIAIVLTAMNEIFMENTKKGN